ncbi:hypothetical protein H4Q26_004030 [Puccinia striiformis f. sp. tritici PST-130]|nr:hypothetical protein H4Q26_004030 [Puccinia striiformis f. sp. tritici PST-130]
MARVTLPGRQGISETPGRNKVDSCCITTGQRSLQILSEIEKQVKYYKDNIIAIHDSMTLEQDAGCRKSRFPFCLVFLESIFNVELD